MSTVARPVVTRSPQRLVGRVNCPWFQEAPIEHESRLEKRFIQRAILFGALRSIGHQPFNIKLSGRERYTPDFLLTFTNSEGVVVEVKRSEKIKQLRDRLDEASQKLRERSLVFFVLHQGQIEGEKRAERASLIRRYAMLAVPGPLIAAVVDAVNSNKRGVPISVLLQQYKLTRPQLFHLIARRHIACSPRLLLSDDDLVYPSVREIANAANQFGDWFGGAPWRTHP